MSILSGSLNQTAVYWGTPAASGFGHKTFAAAVEVDCRWEEKSDLYIDRKGKEFVSRSVVFVGQDLDIGGYLYLGELDDLDSDPAPTDVSGAYEIRAFQKIPDLKGTDFVRKAIL